MQNCSDPAKASETDILWLQGILRDVRRALPGDGYRAAEEKARRKLPAFLNRALKSLAARRTKDGSKMQKQIKCQKTNKMQKMNIQGDSAGRRNNGKSNDQ